MATSHVRDEDADQLLAPTEQISTLVATNWGNRRFESSSGTIFGRLSFRGLEARLQRGWGRNRLGDLVFYVRKPAGRSAPVEENSNPKSLTRKVKTPRSSNSGMNRMLINGPK